MYTTIIHFETKEALEQFNKWLLDVGNARYYEDCLYSDLPCVKILTAPSHSVSKAYSMSLYFAAGLEDKREHNEME